MTDNLVATKVRMPQHLHAQLLQHCAQSGMSGNAVQIAALGEYLRKQGYAGLRKAAEK